MKLQQLTGTMQCPYCMARAEVTVAQINRRLQCSNCDGQFVAALEPPKDIVRLSMACSFILQPFVTVYQKQDGRYKFVTTVMPKRTGRTIVTCNNYLATQKVGSIDMAIFDLTLGFSCPWCMSNGLDLCGCHTFICQQRSRPLPSGLRMNTCPQCGDGEFSQPLLEVPIYSVPPAVKKPVPPAQAKVALPLGSALTKWRGQ